MEKGAGFLAVVLVWGGLLYFLFNGSIAPNFNIGRLSASALLNFSLGSNEQAEVIGSFDDNKESFRAATVHFDKSVDVFDIKVSPSNSGLIFAASNRGLFLTKDGGLNWYSFSDLEHKIDSTTTVYKILFSGDQSYISTFQNGKGIVYRSQDDFFSLEKIFEVDNEAIYDFGTGGGNLYLGLSNGRLIAYSLRNNDFRELTTLGSPIIKLEITSGGGLIYLTLKSGGFWVSRDGGQSFSRQAFLDDYRGADKINDFLTSSLSSSLVYAATDYGLIRSSNAGASWEIFKSLPTEVSRVSALNLKDNPSEIFAASGGKIYKSLDRGLNWQIFDSGFNNREISTILINGDKIIIGTKAI